MLVYTGKKIRKIEGGTANYYDRIALDEEIYEKTRLNDEAKRKEIEAFVKRFKAKATLASRAQSRVKTLEKMEKKQRLEALEELEFSFRYKPSVSDIVLQAEDLSYAYPGGAVLFEDISLILSKKDRLCIIGKNGAGKSTLLKTLAGDLTPVKGKVIGADADAGYFEQTNIQRLPTEATVEDEIARAADYKLEKTQIRNICASMMFSGDDALKQIKVLSGGEKCRVMLGKILAKPAPYLLLDEPTNHLDMDAADSLLEAIDSFPGAVVLVTHNESYLINLATRLIVFQGDKPFIFEGTYQEFLDKIGWQDEEGGKKASKTDKKENKRNRAAIIAEKSKELKPLVEKIEELEEKIVNKEEELSEIHKEIEKATGHQDGLLLSELGEKLGALEVEIDSYYEELNEVTMVYDERSNYYSEKLADN